MCYGRRPQVVHDSVASAPHLLAECHPRKNGKLTPQGVTLGSGKVVWWKGSKDAEHEWPATITNRVNGRGCPTA